MNYSLGLESSPKFYVLKAMLLLSGGTFKGGAYWIQVIEGAHWGVLFREQWDPSTSPAVF